MLSGRTSRKEEAVVEDAFLGQALTRVEPGIDDPPGDVICPCIQREELNHGVPERRSKTCVL